jgi:hypothetical protein
MTYYNKVVLQYFEYIKANQMRYNIVLPSLTNKKHNLLYIEVGEALYYSMDALGLQTTISHSMLRNAVNILVSTHTTPPEALQHSSPKTIFLNTEPLGILSTNILEQVTNWAKKCEIWDYDLHNTKLLKANGALCVKTFNFGYRRELDRIIPAPEQDIDVLFYGIVSPRRKKVFDAIKERGLKFEHVIGVHGSERDSYISRAKVVLNMHYYKEVSVFEMVRVFYLMTNSKAIVGEVGPMTTINPIYLPGIQASLYENLVENCELLVKNDSIRKALETKAHETIMKYPQEDFIRELENL